MLHAKNPTLRTQVATGLFSWRHVAVMASGMLLLAAACYFDHVHWDFDVDQEIATLGAPLDSEVFRQDARYLFWWIEMAVGGIAGVVLLKWIKRLHPPSWSPVPSQYTRWLLRGMIAIPALVLVVAGAFCQNVLSPTTSDGQIVAVPGTFRGIDFVDHGPFRCAVHVHCQTNDGMDQGRHFSLFPDPAAIATLQGIAVGSPITLIVCGNEIRDISRRNMSGVQYFWNPDPATDLIDTTRIAIEKWQSENNWGIFAATLVDAGIWLLICIAFIVPIPLRPNPTAADAIPLPIHPSATGATPADPSPSAPGFN